MRNRWERSWLLLTASVAVAGLGLSCGRDAGVAEADRLSERVGQLHGQGKYAEAVPLAQRALAIREKALGPGHPNTVSSTKNLAACLRSLGKEAEAAELEWAGE